MIINYGVQITDKMTGRTTKLFFWYLFMTHTTMIIALPSEKLDKLRQVIN